MPVYNTAPYNNSWGPNQPNVTAAYAPAYNPPTYANQQQFSNILVVPVQSKDGANSYPVAAGATVLLLDYDHRKFWLKTNNNGVSMTMTEHTFVSENDVSSAEKSKEDYVTRKEFMELKTMLEDLTKPS
jgi:hypothetical protein